MANKKTSGETPQGLISCKEWGKKMNYIEIMQAIAEGITGNPTEDVVYL